MDRQPAGPCIVTVPNAISLARLFAVPVAVWLVLIAQWRSAFWLFLAAGLSDALDGWIARRGARSRLGAVLDPLADKLLLACMYVVLAATRLLPEWLAILVVFRDLLIVGGIALLAYLGHVVPIAPLPLSKANTAAQIALVALTLCCASFGWKRPPGFSLLVAAVAATTLSSGAAYLWREAAGTGHHV
jgi:cardiolipin synthase